MKIKMQWITGGYVWSPCLHWPYISSALSPLCCSCWAHPAGSTWQRGERLNTCRWQSGRKPQSKAASPNVFYKQTPVDTWPTEPFVIVVIETVSQSWCGRRDSLTSYLQVLKTLTGRRSGYSWHEAMSSSTSKKKQRLKYWLLIAAINCVAFFFMISANRARAEASK